MVTTADTVTISGNKRSFETAVVAGPDQEAPLVSSIA
jgi:hypothetical protein